MEPPAWLWRSVALSNLQRCVYDVPGTSVSMHQCPVVPVAAAIIVTQICKNVLRYAQDSHSGATAYLVRDKDGFRFALR